MDKVPVFSMGYGMTAAADGRWFPWVFNFPTTYWSQASAVIRYIGQQEGGLDKLKGKKIAHIYHNSPYGKEANPTLEELSRRFGFELTLLAVDHPGQEQKSTWLQVRRLNPDWIFMSGWGVMNQVAIKEAAAIGFKMDHLIGNWWSASDADVIPAGDGAKGYKGATFHAPGTNFKVHQEIFRVLYDQGKGAGKKEAVGEVLYNRGIVNAMFTVEAIRTAMAKFGNKPLTGEQMRWGLENLNVTDKRLEELGMKGFTHPVKVTCEDHEGAGPVLFEQWDGKKWSIVSEWVPVMKDVVRPEARGRGRRRGEEAGLHHARLREGEIDTNAVSDRPAPLLSVNNVEVIYDHVILVLKGVSLQVAEGSIVALLGANGAGKSTTLKAISGLLRTERGDVSKGSIELLGEPIHRRDPAEVVARGVVQVMEGRRVFEHLTVEENLLAGAYTQGGATLRHDLDRVYAYFPRLYERRGGYAGYISGGEQQMLAIGRALMAHPRLMLLDEPSMGLAPMLVAEIFQIVARLNREEKLAVLLAEQNAAMALKVAGHAYVMENGRVVLDGDGPTIAENEDIKEFYLGLSGVGQRKSYRDVKHYRRRKRWLS